MTGPLRAPLMIPAALLERLTSGDDAIIRSDAPVIMRCGGIDRPPVEVPADLACGGWPSGSILRTGRPGERCTSGCKTKDHYSYAECLRDKGTKTYLASPSKGLDGTAQKRWDGELDRYRAARKEGIRPDGTTMPKVMDAIRRSDEAGAAYGRDFSKATPLED